jgi:hypothetical protein
LELVRLRDQLVGRWPYRRVAIHQVEQVSTGQVLTRETHEPLPTSMTTHVLTDLITNAVATAAVVFVADLAMLSMSARRKLRDVTVRSVHAQRVSPDRLAIRRRIRG